MLPSDGGFASSCRIDASASGMSTGSVHLFFRRSSSFVLMSIRSVVCWKPIIGSGPNIHIVESWPDRRVQTDDLSQEL